MKNNYNLAVRDAEPLDAALHGEHISDMEIVEPEAARVHQHSPVVRVSGGGEGGGEAHRARGGGDDEERKERSLHFLSCQSGRFFVNSRNRAQMFV